MDDETIEDVKAAYALLYRDMAALRVKADALKDALERMCDEQDSNEGYTTCGTYDSARTAIANYTGA